jgi:iron complex transport system substrate-binding protein
MPDMEKLSAMVVDAGFKLHDALGPGLLESAYELILCERLRHMGLKVDRQMPSNIAYDGIAIENAFRIDLLVEDRLVIELKSVEQTLPVHMKQVLTYLRLTGLTLGFVMNFGAPTFKAGVRRVVNGHGGFASSRLRVMQNPGLAT